MERRNMEAPNQPDTFSAPDASNFERGGNLFTEAAEQAEKRQEFQEYMLARLEQEGVVVRPSAGEIVVDLDKLKVGLGELSRRSTSTLKNKYPEFSGQGGVDIQEVLMNTFSDAKVLSADDYALDEEKRPEPKSLFYVPKSEGAAYSLRDIKKSDFYLGQWEAGGKIHYDKVLPTQNGQKVPMNEAVLATIIYHPKFGDGYRDEQSGRLMVRNKATREYGPITLNWLQRDMGFSGGYEPGSKTKKVDSPRKYLREEAPRIIESGLLMPDDFKDKGGTKKSNQEYRRQGEIGENGFTMIDGVNYYIGKGKNFSTARVCKMSPSLAGVVFAGEQGDEKLEYVFSLKQANELSQLGKSNAPDGKLGFYYATKEQAQLRPYDANDFKQRRADESKREFEERCLAMDDFDHLLRFSQQLSRETGINLSNFSFAEQSAIGYAVKHIEKEPSEIISFVKNYGESGLRSLFSAEYGSQYGENVLKIGQQVERAEAQELFRNYAELSQAAGRMSEIINESEAWRGSGLSDSIKQAGEYQISEAILRRAKDMLNVAHEITKNGKAEATIYGKQQVECNEVKEVSQAMAVYKEALDKILLLLSAESGDSIVALDHAAGEVESYNFRLPGKGAKDDYLKVQLREKGVPPAEVDKTKYFDGQARINFLFSDQYIPEEIQDPVRRDALSIRLDREGRIEEGGKLRFDDTLPNGEVSLDAGTLTGTNVDSENYLLGKVVAIGNALDVKLAKSQKNPQYYHNRESFSKELGQAEVFAEFVKLIRQLINDKFAFTEQQKAKAA